MSDSAHPTEGRTGARAPRGPTAPPVLGTLAALVLISAVAACGAPASQPATGPVADDVRASLDSGTAPFSHERWDRLLSSGGVGEGGLADYRYFQRHRAELDAYLRRVAGADLASLAPPHLKALLINAYNAYTVQVILDHPAVSSIRDIDGVWTELTFPVGGHDLTLDQMEHNLLRPFFEDPRIHFAVNCASLSCAPLPPWAFSGDSMDAELERRTRAFLRDTANVRVEDGTLRLSRYFDWYGGDFTEPDWEPRAETIPLFVARYARPGVADFVREHDGRPPVSFLPYDWSLNAAAAPEVGARPSGAAPRFASVAPLPPALLPRLAARPADQEADEPPSGAGWVADLRAWVDGFGVAAPAVYGLVYAVATVALVPGSALTVGAGVGFGLLWGTVVASLASILGAGAAFLVARYLAREKVARWVSRKEKFDAVDRAVGEEGWKVVALTRLSPVFPFNFLNYAFGLTRVGFWPYLLTSWVAMLPGTLMYVYVGVAAADVASAATGATDWGRTALQVVGLLATVAVVVVVTRAARRALEQAAGEGAAALEEAATEEAG